MSQSGGNQCVCGKCKGQVRMVVYDYDGAPDGVGTYVVVDRVLSSESAALQHWVEWLKRLGWGHVETAECGEFIRGVDEFDEH